MEKQLIISVGREYGSGGHEIAEKLSGHYGIQLFDHNLLDEIAAKKNLNMEHLKGLDERRKNPLSSRTVRGFSSSPEENLLYLQFDFLRDKADSGESFVIVGRCSETILTEDALRSAAYTYVVAALGSLATLLYYIMIFLGGRSRD